MLGLPFILFVVVMTGTPGPGNLAHMAIGQTTGFRSALPFLAGTTVGAACVDAVVALGVGRILVASEVAGMVLRIVGTAYILYLAWKVVRMDMGVPGGVKRFSFLDGVFVHPLSPKTWAMSLAAFSQFSDPAAPLAAQVAVFVLVFMVFQVFFHSLWCVAGVGLMRVLRSGHVRVAVNCVVALIMVGVTLHALLA